MYATRREEYEHGIVTLAALETCRDGLEVGQDEGADTPAIASSNGRIRRAVDHEVQATDVFEFVELAGIRLDELHAAPVQSLDRKLTSAARKIIERDNLVVAMLPLPCDRDRRTDEPGASSHQHAHGLFSFRPVPGDAA